MVQTLEVLIAHAGTPRRFHTALRHQTRAVRRFYDAFAGINRVPSRISETIMGGDILGVMSDHLRRLLRSPDEPTPGAAMARRPRFSESPANAPGAEWSVGDLLAASRQQSRDWPAWGVAASPHQDLFLVGSDRESTSASRTDIKNDEHSPERSRSLSWPASLLSRKLNTYWELSKGEAIAEGSRNGSAASTNGVEPETGSRRQAMADAMGNELAERLRAFASGQTLRPGVIARDKTADALSQKVDIHDVFNIAVRSEVEGSGSLEELSGKVAEILRLQALEQGIDIT